MSGHRTKQLRRALRQHLGQFTTAQWRAWKRAWTRTHHLPRLEG